jgi:putative transposase
LLQRAESRKKEARKKGSKGLSSEIDLRYPAAMPRQLRAALGGLAYHVMNRTSSKIDLFEDAGDYEAFLRVLSEASQRGRGMRVCAYCLMPNHFHLVLWPKADGQLSSFMQWLTMTHALRWHAHRHSVGRGHLYQSRFKNFAIQRDAHFLGVCRYVERNAVRAGLCDRAESWRWSSAWARDHDDDPVRARLTDWPVQRPANWIHLLNTPQKEAELAAIHAARNRGRPYGAETWATRTAKKLGVESSLRPIGRPKKESNCLPSC